MVSWPQWDCWGESGWCKGGWSGGGRVGRRATAGNVIEERQWRRRAHVLRGAARWRRWGARGRSAGDGARPDVRVGAGLQNAPLSDAESFGHHGRPARPGAWVTRRAAGGGGRRRAGRRPSSGSWSSSPPRSPTTGYLRAGRRAVPGVVRGAWSRAAGDCPAPRGGRHSDASGVGADGEAALGGHPGALRLGSSSTRCFW